MEKFPKIFIIVLNYNGKDVLRDNIASLMELSYSDFEVVLVDNNSQDGSVEIIRSMWPKIHLIRNSQNIGFAAGNNIGIKFALERGARYVLLINNDTICEKNFLSRLVEVGQKNKEIGLLSPVIHEGKTKKIWFSGGRISWLRMKTFHDTREIKKDIRIVKFITGCAMLVKRGVFSKIGLLDEDYFLYWEDADFSFRANRNGYKGAVVSDSRIFHLEKSRDNKSKVYWLVISGLIFFRKNTPIALIPWIFMYTALRRIKNKRDIRKRKRFETAMLVKKAYDDFRKTKL
jgi:GT2 family glycosyltransferase